MRRGKPVTCRGHCKAIPYRYRYGPDTSPYRQSSRFFDGGPRWASLGRVNGQGQRSAQAKKHAEGEIVMARGTIVVRTQKDGTRRYATVIRINGKQRWKTFGTM